MIVLRTIFCVLMLLACAAPVRAADVTPEQVVTSLRAAAQYMVSAQMPDGSFHYQYDFQTGKYSDKNNFVRQAGAGSVLSQYLAVTGDQAVVPAIKAAIGYYVAQSAPLKNGVVID